MADFEVEITRSRTEIRLIQQSATIIVEADSEAEEAGIPDDVASFMNSSSDTKDEEGATEIEVDNIVQVRLAEGTIPDLIKLDSEWGHHWPCPLNA